MFRNDFYGLEESAQQILANRLKAEDWSQFGDESKGNPLPHIEDLISDIQDWVNHYAERCYQDFEGAISEFEKSTCAWVKAGAIAHLIKFKKLYLVVNDIAEEKIKSFEEFCIRILKRSRWSINRLIESSYVFLALARKGFVVLPQNEFQASKLVKFARKFIPKDPSEYYDADRIGDDELFAKWQEVIDKIPPHELSATKIAEIVDDIQPLNTSVHLRKNTKIELITEAASEGISADELVMQMVIERRLRKLQAAQETIEESEDKEEPQEPTEFKSTDGEVVKPKPPHRLPSIFSSLYSQPKSRNHDSRLAQGVVPFGDDGWINSS